jgi:hypothetical protein
MGTMLYKHHVITTDANWNEVSEKYVSVGRVVWQAHDGQREVHSFTLAEQSSTFDEAYAMALEKAKDWADRRLTRLHRNPMMGLLSQE